jgi:hypothetical protein
MYKTVDSEELSLEILQFLAHSRNADPKSDKVFGPGKGGGGIGGFFSYRKGRHCFKEISLKTLEEKQRLLRHNHEISDVKFVLESVHN